MLSSSALACSSKPGPEQCNGHDDDCNGKVDDASAMRIAREVANKIEAEMTYPHIKPALKTRIKSIPVKEFGGINHLPDTISDLVRF